MFHPYSQDLRSISKIEKSQSKIKEGIDIRTKRIIFRYLIYGVSFIVLIILYDHRVLGRSLNRILPLVLIGIIADVIVRLVRRKKLKSKE